jgi:peptidyl-prolyl cis-trans isomerase C
MVSSIALRWAALLPALVFSVAAQAAEPVFAQHGTLRIDSDDVRGDALRLPPESRPQLLSEPRAVMQLSSNLLVRRVLAEEAEKLELTKDPAVQAALRIARDRTLSDLMLARLDAAARPSVAVLEKQAETAYKATPARFAMPDETRVRHILFLRETPDAKAKAEEVLAKLKAGASFEDLATTQSQDPGSAVRGGDLGFNPKGRMVPEFEAAIEKLKTPGELSGVVETPFGFHVIKLEARRAAGTRPFAEVREPLMRELEMQAVNDARNAKAKQIQDAIQLNAAAIEEFSQSQKSVLKR